MTSVSKMLLSIFCILSSFTYVHPTQVEQVCDGSSCNVEYFSAESLPIVILDYHDLNNKIDLSNSIETAYGRSGLGILFVKNVPDLAAKRTRLLRLSRELAHLDEEVKQSLEDADSLYSIGYSHGKERLAKNQNDTRKISYYANPLANDVSNGDQELVTNYRAVYGANIWPTQHLPRLEEAFMDFGTLIHSVGQLIAHQLDLYVMRERDGYKPGLFPNHVIGTNIPKARLLYYLSDKEMHEFGYDEDEQTEIDSETEETDEREDGWCGWHNDHSALTGLALGMFFDAQGNVIDDIREYGEGGLFIKTRENITHQVALNEEEAAKYLAFQIGETSQILSAGALVATPHAVMAYRGETAREISRASFAVFHQPHHDLSMTAPFHEGVSIDDIQFDRFLPPTVPTLSSRWNNATHDTFGQFSTRTFETYYDMKMK